MDSSRSASFKCYGNNPQQGQAVLVYCDQWALGELLISFLCQAGMQAGLCDSYMETQIMLESCPHDWVLIVQESCLKSSLELLRGARQGNSQVQGILMSQFLTKEKVMQALNVSGVSREQVKVSRVGGVENGSLYRFQVDNLDLNWSFDLCPKDFKALERIFNLKRSRLILKSEFKGSYAAYSHSR